MAPVNTHPCPKCGRPLEPSGETTTSDDSGRILERFTVYQCDECLVHEELFGERTEMALTFVLGRDGMPRDPADPDKPLNLQWDGPEARDPLA